MALPLALLAGVGAATGLAGSALSYKGQREANKTNIELARQGREHDVDMWNRQNAYNTPEMQMQRLKEAGLNPNLIYGSGQASTGNADAPKQAHVATTSNELASFNANSAIQMLGAYQDWQVKKAQIKNINAETQAKLFGNEYEGYLRPYYNLMADDYRKKKFYEGEYQQSSALDKYQDWMTKSYQYLQDKKHGAFQSRSLMHQSRLNESKQRFEYLKRQTDQKDLQIQLDQQLKPYGMSTADELWQRKLVPIIEDLISPRKRINKLFKK